MSISAGKAPVSIFRHIIKNSSAVVALIGFAALILTLHSAEGPHRGRRWPRKVDHLDSPLRTSKVGVRKIHVWSLVHVTFLRGGKLGTSQGEFVKLLFSQLKIGLKMGF